jgi:hypothetical protein
MLGVDFGLGAWIAKLQIAATQTRFICATLAQLDPSVGDARGDAADIFLASP